MRDKGETRTHEKENECKQNRYISLAVFVKILADHITSEYDSGNYIYQRSKDFMLL